MDILELKQLIEQGLSQREISVKIGKSHASIKYWLKKYDLRTCINRNIKNCTKCQQNLPKEAFYKSGGYCKKCMTAVVIAKQRLFKQQCIQYKGGKCIHCGYCTYDAALEFHHIDPNEKDFQINRYRLCKLDDRVKNELDKCELLCANCHREAHGRINGTLAQR